ncbi:hypothetical protein N1851_033863 [Merluccius polli]|uniref:Uncharacterized protein n=1 Tax=Merluccius polli TaxID=89951 RepID=A0AA47M0N2_MERPO|nr:hypothetical protein N1851_033863 [Merluccius polli]
MLICLDMPLSVALSFVDAVSSLVTWRGSATGYRKLATTELLSRSSGGKPAGSETILGAQGEASKLVAPCPHLVVRMGGIEVPCLLDTGSMVSTMLKAANGLAIPYVGYLELDMECCGQQMERCGVLVVKDPPGGVSAQVPGVLGMNVIRRCYRQLFGQHGLALFDSPSVSEASGCMMEALQKCHQANVQAPEKDPGSGW